MIQCPRLFLNVLKSSSRVICTSVKYNSNKSDTQVLASKSSEKPPDGFITVYKFPYIRALSIVNRLKLYQTAVTAFAIPASFVLNQFSFVDSETVQLTSVLGLTGCVTFYSLGYITEKFIGFVYVHEQDDTVKLSYIDFWGQRKDEVLPIDDVAPFSESPVSVTDPIFFKVKRYSKKDLLKLNMKYGQIVDSDKFNKIFIPLYY